MKLRVGYLCLVPLLLGLSPEGSSTDDALLKLDRFGRRFADRVRALSDDDWEDAEQLFVDLRGAAREGRARREAATRVLLDVYGFGVNATNDREADRIADGFRMTNRASKELSFLMDARLSEWIAREVVVVGAGNPVDRRAAGALVLRERREPSVLPALLVASRSEEAVLKGAAIEALVGWPDDLAHRLHLGLLREADATMPPQWIGASRTHFRRLRLKEGQSINSELEALVRATLEDEDWRRAALGAEISWALPDGEAVPLLLSAMETWTKRALAGQPVRRILGDVTRELEQRSGLKLGPYPDRWLAWWSNVRAGKTGPLPDAPPPDRTTAAFFGLRPSSDRVVLIMDRSGSMSVPFLTKGQSNTGTKNRPWTRHDEVLSQLKSYLSGLSPQGRFNLVVFGDQARVWRSKLQAASESQARAGQTWAQRQGPKGGTHLRLGIQAALGIDREGELDLDELEADTLVVLCDGKTASGPDWVTPFLRRYRAQTGVVVHGVQIGADGDGTLETLAEGTGGEFVRVAD